MSRTPRQRHRRKLREALEAAPVIIAEPVPYVPSPEFTRAYSVIGEVGPIGSRWETINRCAWLLQTNSPSDHRRNHPRG
jgi:hypothetical protein